MSTVSQKLYFNEISAGAATSILRNEHNAVLGVLYALDKAVVRLKAEREVPLAFFEDVLEFLTIFVDKCHHSKEEEVLFPILKQGGIPQEGGPIGQMLIEHEQGREFIREMQRGLESIKENVPAGRYFLVGGAEGYSNLLKSHIMKENQVLFVMADSLLRPGVQEELVEQFEEIENNKIGAGTHERLHGKIEQLIALAAEW